jgi:hypothetical protein
MVSHLKKTDPSYSLYSGSIQVYKCPKCGREEGNPAFLRCPTDNTMMVRHDYLSDSVTDEIRNRIDDGTPPPASEPMTRERMWDEGMVNPVRHTLRPIGGKDGMTIEAKWNKEAYLDRIIKITDDHSTRYVRLNDLGEALEGVL